MKSEDILAALGNVEEGFIEEAAPRVVKSNRIRWIAVAACLALVLVFSQSRSIPLTDASANVSASYALVPFAAENAGCLVYLTEEEIFTTFPLAIFEGTITDTDDIVLNFNGAKSYMALLRIRVEKVYQGPCAVGETITVLNSAPIGSLGIYATGNDTVSAIKEGMTGIFMPMIYDEDSFREENGARLRLKDLADYGFPDGVRYAFLDTAEGLVFSRSAFESIASARTLDEIEAYITKMLQRIG